MSIQGTERSSTPRKSSPYEGLPPRVPAFRQGPGMPEGSLSSLLNLPASRTLGTCEQMNNMPRAVSTLPSSGSSPGPIHWATPGLEICCGSPELLTGCIPNEESDLGTTDAPESRIGTKMPLSPGCLDPWVGKIPWRKAWQPTSLFLPGESHGQRSLAGCSP